MTPRDDDATAAPPPASEGSVPDPTKQAASTGGDIQGYIGNRLRQAFDDIAQQPVPERFLQLMRDLDKA